MSVIVNYMVLAGCDHTDADTQPDDLPAPWVRLDGYVHGDGKAMEARVWARVANHGPSIADVSAELRSHPWWDPDEVMLIAKDEDWPEWRVIDWRGTSVPILPPRR